jgi:anti-sigma B factor antagonist
MTMIVAPGGVVFVGADDFGSVVITPCGDLDMASAPTLLSILRQAISTRPPRIVLDLSSVAFLDSTGCNALAVAWRDARAVGVRLALCDEMTPVVRRVLAVTMLSPVFDPVWPSPHR